MDRNSQAGDGDGPLEAAWEEHRRYLLNIAYRLLGSLNEAEDMVQEAYVRLMRSDVDAIHDVRGWLVVVTTRICLDHLGSARSRREAQASPWFPEPIVQTKGHERDPADIVILDESVRMALLIVLERLKPAERVADPESRHAGMPHGCSTEYSARWHSCSTGWGLSSHLCRKSSA
jgi:RNA polymerase sigma-70 factor (ECF subfamily)